jgi:membrane-associated protease RseP (regulator of RpoE activity)
VLAKRFGMPVTRYFVGFGPTIWSTWRNGTEYGIKALPFGGFVKIVGMHSLDDPDDPADEPRSFRRQAAWKRIAVLVAGSFMHFLLAFLLIAGLALTVGVAGDNDTQMGTVSACVPANLAAYSNSSCAGSKQASPAQQAGLRVGDTVTAFDARPVSTWTQLDNAIKAAHPGQPVTLTVRRNGQLTTLHTTLSSVPGRSGAYLGIAPATVFQIASPWGALAYAGTTFGQTLVGSADAVASLPSALPKLFSADRSKTAAGQVGSVVGAAEATSQVVGANWGWQYKVSVVLLIIASLNIFIGAFNLLPLLPMDGGHVAAILYERIRAWFARLRGRPDPGLVDMAKLVPVSFSLFVVLIFFSVAVVLADIVNPVNFLSG